MRITKQTSEILHYTLIMLSWANPGFFILTALGRSKGFSSRNEQIWTRSDYSLMCQFRWKSRHLETVLRVCRYLTSVKSLTGHSATFNVHSKKFGAPPSPSDDRIFLNNLKFTPTWNADLGIHFFGHMLHHISAVHKDKNFRSLEAEHFLLQKRIYIFPDIAQATQAWIKKMTLKAEFSSLGINTVILFPATFSILLDEEKNVLHKCRDVEHILMTHIKAIRGYEDANKIFWSYKIIQLKIHFSMTLLSFFSFCAFFFFFLSPLLY